MNTNNTDGIKQQIRDRVLQATDAESLKAIRQALKEEGYAQGSIDAVISELRKKGFLKFDEAKATSTRSMPKDLVPTMQSFIEDVHVPRPVDGQDGYWDGYEMGARRARQDLIFSLLAMRELSSQSTAQVVSLAKELRGQQNSAEVAQVIAGELAQATLESNRGILEAIKSQAIASSPNPMLAMMTQAMQPMFQQAFSGLAGVFSGKHKPQPGQGRGDVEQPPGAEETEQQSQAPIDAPSIEKHSRDEWEE